MGLSIPNSAKCYFVTHLGNVQNSQWSIPIWMSFMCNKADFVQTRNLIEWKAEAIAGIKEMNCDSNYSNK